MTKTATKSIKRSIKKSIKKITKKPISNVLPNKPSELIRVAIKDLKKCENLKNHVIDMNIWYITNHRCKTCLAGSVLRQTLKEKTNSILKTIDKNEDGEKELDPNDFSESISRKLHALDCLRVGSIKPFLNRFTTKISLNSLYQLDNIIENFHDSFREYEENEVLFKESLLKLADDLSEMGL